MTYVDEHIVWISKSVTIATCVQVTSQKERKQSLAREQASQNLQSINGGIHSKQQHVNLHPGFKKLPAYDQDDTEAL